MSRDFYAPILKDKRARKKCEELQFFFLFFGFFVWQYFRGIWSFSTSHERKRNSKFVHLNKSMYLTKWFLSLDLIVLVTFVFISYVFNSIINFDQIWQLCILIEGTLTATLILRYGHENYFVSRNNHTICFFLNTINYHFDISHRSMCGYF